MTDIEKRIALALRTLARTAKEDYLSRDWISPSKSNLPAAIRYRDVEGAYEDMCALLIEDQTGVLGTPEDAQ